MALADAYVALDQFKANLRDADRCLAMERLGLASAWNEVDAATKEAWSQGEAAAAGSREEAAKERVVCDDTLAEAVSTANRCDKAVASLKVLCSSSWRMTLRLASRSLQIETLCR